MNKLPFFLCVGLALVSFQSFAEDNAYEACMKNSPYANKDVADKECRGISEKVQSVPEKFAIEDQNLAIQNEIARQNQLNIAANLLLQHQFRGHRH